MKALLIIDMQKGCFSPYTLRHDTMGVIERINALSEKFRAKQYPVIFIQHDGTVEGELFPHTDDWMLLPELTQQPGDIYIGKTANDSFYKSALQEALATNGVTDLVVTGSATDFCVDATIKAALSKDFAITVVADGHTTSGKPNLPADVLVDYYNWLWSAMSPTKTKMAVQNASTIEV